MTERSPLCRHSEVREECGICKPFIDAARRRRENGIRLKRFSVMADESQVVGLNELWSGWIERFGKQKAVDVLLKLMSEVDARIREQDAR